MRYLFLFCFIASVTIGCDFNKRTSSETNSLSKKTGTPIEGDSLSTIFGSKGVVRFRNTDTNLKKDITIYNDDGTIYLNISVDRDELTVDGQKYKLSDYEQYRELLSTSHGFTPMSFYPENGFLFQFEYRTASSSKIEIYVDSQDKSVIKFIPNDPEIFEVENWENHMMGAIVNFNVRNNPLRENPSERSEPINLGKYGDLAFAISRLHGEWAEIECVDFCETSFPQEKVKGWIRWREGKEVLIKFIYAC